MKLRESKKIFVSNNFSVFDSFIPYVVIFDVYCFQP